MTRLRYRLAALAISALLASCVNASTDDAEGVLAATNDKLAEITSGDLSLRLSNMPRGGEEGGFSLEGPFSLASDGDLPSADFDYTAFDGEEETSARFVSTGERAYIVQGDETTRLSQGQIDETGLHDLVRTDETPLGKLDIDEWVAGEPEVSAGGLVGGVDTDKVTARLDVPKVMDGLVAIAKATGGRAGLEPLEDAEADRVRRAVNDATLQVWSGKDDRIMRKLDATIEFAVDDERLTEALEELAGATIRLEASVENVNEPVEIEDPTE